MYRPTARPRWFSAQLKRIQRMPAGVTIASATPSRRRRAKSCQKEPASAAAADNRLQQKKLTA